MEAAAKLWKDFLISLAIGEGILGEIKKEIPQFDLLPSRQVSFWIPREWRKEKGDVIVVQVDKDIMDNFVHEAAHASWTWRDEKTRQLLKEWGDLLNILEDARVEFLASTQWGYSFNEEFPPFSSAPWGWMERGEKLAWGVYIKKIENSTGKKIPPEWEKALEELKEDLERCYEELLRVKSPEEMEEFLVKWWGEPPKRPGYLPHTGEELVDEKRQEKEIMEGRRLKKELEGGSKKTQHKFEGDPPSPERVKRVERLLRQLAFNEVDKVPSLYGRYNFRRDMRGKEDCFVGRKLVSSSLLLVIDTSASMLPLREDVRALLLAIKELSKGGALEGAVLFVGGGECIKVPLPTDKPIEKVVFRGGTNGYKKAVSPAQAYDLIIFLSDLAIDEEDRKAIEVIGRKAYFLYGGPYHGVLHGLADRWKIPKSRRLFAPTIEGAIKLLLEVVLKS